MRYYGILAYMHKLHSIHLPKPSYTTLVLIILTIITIGLALSTAILGSKVRILWGLHNSDLSTVRGYIKDANEALYTPVAVDPVGRQQYVYESAVRFPAAKNHYDNFRYFYTPADQSTNTEEQITLGSQSSLNAAYNALGSEVFKNVNTYQSCSKTFIIQFADTVVQNGFKKTATKPLADGRTAYIYTNGSCDSVYKDGSLDVTTQQSLVDAIESY